jgi:hypothetical protein
VALCGCEKRSRSLPHIRAERFNEVLCTYSRSVCICTHYIQSGHVVLRAMGIAPRKQPPGKLQKATAVWGEAQDKFMVRAAEKRGKRAQLRIEK